MIFSVSSRREGRFYKKTPRRQPGAKGELGEEIKTTLRNEDSTSAPRMRCIVEIIGGELAIYPIANCDTDEKLYLTPSGLSPRKALNE
jgi:hypothetical protein